MSKIGRRIDYDKRGELLVSQKKKNKTDPNRGPCGGEGESPVDRQKKEGQGVENWGNGGSSPF